MELRAVIQQAMDPVYLACATTAGLVATSSHGRLHNCALKRCLNAGHFERD
jgi:hypothetical protein